MRIRALFRQSCPASLGVRGRSRRSADAASFRVGAASRWNRANFRGADLEDADLRNANLEHTYFMEARLEGADFGGAHSVGAVFSWSSGDAKTQLPAGVPAILGHALVPLNTADFSFYLLLAKASKAQTIGLANAGGDTINSIKQAAEFGIVAGGQCHVVVWSEKPIVWAPSLSSITRAKCAGCFAVARSHEDAERRSAGGQRASYKVRVEITSRIADLALFIRHKISIWMLPGTHIAWSVASAVALA
jgi:hypothetical protein